jgi:hypothetical protein
MGHRRKQLFRIALLTALIVGAGIAPALADALQETSHSVAPAAWKPGEFSLELFKAVGTILSIVLPLSIVAWNYRNQVNLQLRQERLSFELKAAEIALNAASANQMNSKINALRDLFPDRLANFGKSDVGGVVSNIDVRKYPMFSTYERMMSLLSLLADKPDQRSEILVAYATLFPEDADSSWARQLADRYGAILPIQYPFNSNRTEGEVDPVHPHFYDVPRIRTGGRNE